MSEPIVLPVEAIAALQEALDDIAAGVNLVSVDEEMTTQELADLLNVSRPYVVSLLEAGEIPFRKVGTKRRVLRSDALIYMNADNQRRHASISELTRESEALRLYEDRSFRARTVRVAEGGRATRTRTGSDAK